MNNETLTQAFEQIFMDEVFTALSPEVVTRLSILKDRIDTLEEQVAD
ncbi:MAG: hypothetical protein GY801_39080 [bacterium]|nr:hypothetical protein [bacterium]